MMLEHVHIAHRFRRSVRIDMDLDDENALDGFVCPRSSADVLLAMAQHISQTGQSAFTWTGPYGSGKSSLIVALASLLNSNKSIRGYASKIVGEDVANKIRSALPVTKAGWKILPIVGSRSHLVSAIGEAMKHAGLVTRRQRCGWTERYIVDKLTDVALKPSNGSSGLLLFIDEMGKFLESAAQENSDIYIFQQLAEAASRSGGRFIFVGVLHQAFSEYAHQLPGEYRDEWAKIQGRFVDLAVNATGDEQIDLISRAIRSKQQPKVISESSLIVAKLSHSSRPSEISEFALRLDRCWPLHPVVACLLGPISRRRFGQNQRSIFGFLNSAELHGFQHYLRHENGDVLYNPSRLWDYLRVNLEPSILSSPDGHRWALASEAIERCESFGSDHLHIRLIKTIAIIDLFKERSGILPNISLLHSCFPEVSKNSLLDCLDRLQKWSLIIFKKYLDAYAIYAGSDFDIEKAIRTQLEEYDSVDFSSLVSLAGLQPILAKRHYHKTGTLRWFEVSLAPLHSIIDLATNPRLESDVVGQIVLAIAVSGEREEDAHRICREAARFSNVKDFVGGYTSRSASIMLYARELVALERIRIERPELSGDSVARKEVEARIAELQGILESELRKSFKAAIWFRKHNSERTYSLSELNKVVSDLADARFNKCPNIHNELLNRNKPSGSAVGARNALLRRMVLNVGEPRLGINGYPAEGGLFDSLIDKPGLYVKKAGEHKFVIPSKRDPCNLLPMWIAATKLVQENKNRTVAISEIYEVWSKEPYGVKDGLMTVYALVFILSQRNHIAVYRDGVFRTNFDDVDIDYLAKSASTIQVRWVDLSALSQRLLVAMTDILRSLGDKSTVINNIEPIDVARGLVKVYEQLPPWTKRTMRLSKNAIRVRELFKRASDPNQFLFNDIPSIVGHETDIDFASESSLQAITQKLHEGLEELVHAYGVMLQSLRSIMYSELHVSESSFDSAENLQERAENIRGVSGDFRVEAFIGRLSHFDGTDNGLEGIISLVINKPSSSWVDLDVDRAMLELADMSQRFLRAETYARVKGRSEKRHSIAVIVGKHGWSEPKMSNFQVGDDDHEKVDLIMERLTVVLEEVGENKERLILAALAELSSNYMTELTELESNTKSRNVQ